MILVVEGVVVLNSSVAEEDGELHRDESVPLGVHEDLSVERHHEERVDFVEEHAIRRVSLVD